MVSILIITHNRFDYFRRCLESVLKTTEKIDKEIILWDNASDDGTKDYILKMSEVYDFIKPVLNETNIGLNAKGKAFEISKGEFIACLDDDILELPEEWAEKMVEAFKSDPELGYLALDVIQNEHTTGAKLSEENYKDKLLDNGQILQTGPAGGWCFMVSRRVYNIVGKFRQAKGRIFILEDGDYVIRCRLKGFYSAILKDVKCFHATGPYYNKNYEKIFENKMKDFNAGIIDVHSVKVKVRQIINKIIKTGKRK